jgi:hypothetical protein
MERGHVLDSMSGTGVLAWIAGAPEFATVLGMKALKTRGKARIPVESYRFEKCGLLKSYAPKPAP